MAFVPPPPYTGDPKTDRPRLAAWLNRRRRERRLAAVLTIAAATLAGLALAAACS